MASRKRKPKQPAPADRPFVMPGTPASVSRARRQSAQSGAPVASSSAVSGAEAPSVSSEALPEGPTPQASPKPIKRPNLNAARAAWGTSSESGVWGSTSSSASRAGSGSSGKPGPSRSRNAASAHRAVSAPSASSSSAPSESEADNTSSEQSSSSAGPSKHGKPKRGANIGRGRNFPAQLHAAFASHDELVTFTEEFNRIHLKPIAPSTEYGHLKAKTFWIQYFTVYLGSLQLAERTWVKDGVLPELAQLKQYFYLLFTTGKSGLQQNKTGWSYHTARIFLGRTWSARKRIGAPVPDKDGLQQIRNALAEWAFKLKELSTSQVPKRSLREVDYIEFLAAVLNPARLVISALCGLMYGKGQHLGAIVEGQDYYNTHQCLQWNDSEWVMCGWKEMLGLLVHSFWTWNWMKNMRNVESEFVRTSLHNLDASRIYMCPQLMCLILGAYLGVFEEDVPAMLADPEKIPHTPLVLTVKPEWKKRPMFSVYGKPDEAIKYDTVARYFRKVAKFLGWQNFTSRSLRYSFAGHMAELVPKSHLNYFMGHSASGILAFTTYQVPDRPTDLVAARFGTAQSRDILDWRSSVTFGRTQDVAQPVVTLEDIQKDMRLTQLLEISAKAEQHLTDHNVQIALDAWVDVLEHYSNMAAHKLGRSRTEPSSSRMRSASVSSAESVITDDDQRARSCSASVLSESLPSSAPSTSAEERETAYRMTAMAAALTTQASTHPFVPVINAHPKNPQNAVARTWAGLLYADQLHDEKKCSHCHGEPGTDSPAYLARMAKNVTEHMWSCELRHYPECRRCNTCTRIILNSDFEDHADCCHDDLCRKIKGDTEDADVDNTAFEDEIVSSDAGVDNVLSEHELVALNAESQPDGAMALSVQSRLMHCHRWHRRYFCPICFFADSQEEVADPNKRRRKKPEVDPDPIAEWEKRTKPFFNSQKLYEHITSHWTDLGFKSKEYHESGLKREGRIFRCQLATCTGSVERNLKAMLEHLHNDHSYRILKCLDDAVTSPLILPDDYRYEADAVLISKLDNTPLPSVVLHEWRDTSMKDRAAKRIRKPRATFSAASAPDTPLDAATASGSDSPLSTSETLSSDAVALRDCVSAYIQTKPQLQDSDLLARLIAQDMTLVDLESLDLDVIQNSFGLTLGVANGLRRAAVAWLARPMHT
ncbi:hypothetical protein OBBRIDRAFT_835257 [Obba rivulosa]|uniref:Uncharacterized protein n=1 Tax=Obba rivulosa TaxID=1052685 RepID=A0A8E2B2L5_9APHY|nr:hypothetical protein OBBRIDRAFT_835257 [Obba rivulosa]